MSQRDRSASPARRSSSEQRRHDEVERALEARAARRLRELVREGEVQARRSRPASGAARARRSRGVVDLAAGEAAARAAPRPQSAPRLSSAACTTYSALSSCGHLDPGARRSQPAAAAGPPSRRPGSCPRRPPRWRVQHRARLDAVADEQHAAGSPDQHVDGHADRRACRRTAPIAPPSSAPGGSCTGQTSATASMPADHRRGDARGLEDAVAALRSSAATRRS